MPQVVVKISSSGVDPKSCQMNKSDTLRWDLAGFQGESVNIDFEGAAQGPFPSSGGEHNPSRGRYTRTGNGDIVTLQPDLTGTFTYTVTVNGTTLDPAIEVRD